MWLGFGWGLLFAAVQSVWALPTLAQRAQVEWAAGVAWAILLGWYGGWCALFGWLVGLLGRGGVGWAIGVASAWVGISWLRSVGNWGFPWAMLSLPLAHFPLLLQPAELGGIVWQRRPVPLSLKPLPQLQQYLEGGVGADGVARMVNRRGAITLLTQVFNRLARGGHGAV